MNVNTLLHLRFDETFKQRDAILVQTKIIDNQIKDQIIAKCNSSILRHEMLKSRDADLKEILKVAKTFKVVEKQAFNNKNRSSS